MQKSQNTKWVVLTGASGGIGENLLRLLRNDDFGVVAIGRDRQKLERIAQSDPLVDVRPHDLADPLETERLILQIKKDRDLVGLINNAAIQNAVLFSDQSAADIDQEIRINLTSAAVLAARFMQDPPKERSFIVNVTSGLAVAPKSNAAVYCASKAGLRNLSAGIDNQIKPDRKIAVIDVVLPLVDTAMTVGRGSGKMAADAAARAIFKSIKRRKRVAWVGKARLLAVINRISPAIAANIMRRG